MKAISIYFSSSHCGSACGRTGLSSKGFKQPSTATFPFPTGIVAHSSGAGSMATGSLAEGREVKSTCGKLSRLLEAGQEDMAEDVERCKQKYWDLWQKKQAGMICSLVSSTFHSPRVPNIGGSKQDQTEAIPSPWEIVPTNSRHFAGAQKLQPYL